ncbi:phospholipid/cholesterol/gamma-HCH transport system substrate-binding protein [Actinomadura hallensis]|uniref:Phospholipid/cholesterol/gamma-HCH transport system substrate-binding protein n=1 Tax=Actinomadura hallensis TaxID=337895 RepID=A0A543IB81_9ACTN|nr:MlaD family protein [Actinomadura hallensis]TQM67846.1 phospholipid/cholesterol/gamma-HCH transport system substrate-binding protein [Actinomadura hallensis]HLV74440.1 MlaD family protein [Vulgatibacteraceae bacterium]
MAMKSFRDRNRVTVGLVSAGTLIALVVSVYLVGTRGLLQDRYTVSGVFAATGNLRSGDEVRVAGVRVGEVTSVEPDHRRGHVVVRWKVDGEVDLGPATRAEIKVANVLGGRYLRLSGPVAEPHLADMPEDERRIPLERTGVPTTINTVLDDSARTVSKLDTGAINKIVAELNGIGDEDRGRLGRALSNLAKLADTVNESEPQIKELLDNGDRVLKLARAKDAELSRLLTNVQIMLDELRKRRAELAAFLGSGNRTVETLTRVIDRQQEKLLSLLADLRGTLGTLRPATGDFNTLLAWAGPTLSGLSGSGGKGPWLEVLATGLGPLSPQDLAGLAELAPKEARR